MVPPRTQLSKPQTRIASLNVQRNADEGAPSVPRRSSVSGLSSVPKAQRTSKTSQKLVVLPSEPQTKPLDEDVGEDLVLGHKTDGGLRELKSEAERMSKVQRRNAGFNRLTAYCVAESFKMKLLASFLKREHNVAPRVFDEALYVMYHLPLLPGYGVHANIRSSAPANPIRGKSFLSHLSEAEENGYQGQYFTTQNKNSTTARQDGYISSTSPVQNRNIRVLPSRHVPPDVSSVHDDIYTGPLTAETEQGSVRYVPYGEVEGPEMGVQQTLRPVRNYPMEASIKPREEEVVEVIFFEYGVVVFFGLHEQQERDILEDIESAGILRRKILDCDWEIEECHFAHDPYISYPRIYNDFFTLKSHSHLLKLSIAHALAQSTLLARYETNAQRVLSAPETLSIPKQLAESGALQLRRHNALKLTGRLFKLRQDVNLVSNVLDVPELFWSEASLKDLYDAVRDYMEIKPRVQVLNEKLGMASEFLEAIHDHLNNSAMERITWIVIWLIVVACLVELGEVIARLAVHASTVGKGNVFIPTWHREEVIQVLAKMMSPSTM